MVEIGFTPFDFWAITGIPVGLGEPPLYDIAAWQSLDSIRAIFPTIRSDQVEGTMLRKEFLRDLCNGIDLGVVTNSEAIADADTWEMECRFLQAFYLLLIGDIFYPNTRSLVSIGWLASVTGDEMFRFGFRDWGSTILARIYMSLDDISRIRIRHGHFCWTPLVYWYYEYIGTPAPVFVSPQYDPFPRMCRYGRGRVVTGLVGGTSHHAGACRRKLEEMTTSSIRWQPFTSASVMGQVMYAAVMTFSRSRRVLRDITTANYTMYLGERCWRQLTGTSVIPYPPPSTLVVSGDDAAAWEAHGYLPMSAEQLKLDCDDQMWCRYWSKVGGGTRLDLRFRHVNIDEVNPAASTDHRLLPSQPSLQGYGGRYEQALYTDLTPFFDDLSIHADAYTPRTFQMTPAVPPTPLPPYETCNPQALYDLCASYRGSLWGYHRECDYQYETHGYPPYHPGATQDSYWSQNEGLPPAQDDDDDDDIGYEDTVGLGDDDEEDESDD